jgi:hypothetical protein
MYAGFHAAVRRRGSFPDVDSARKVLFLTICQCAEPPKPDRQDQQLDYHLQRTHLAYGDRLGTDWAMR